MRISAFHTSRRLSLGKQVAIDLSDLFDVKVRPRFFPFGNGPVNEQGVAHYDDVIASMVALGIKPAVTLYHWGQHIYYVFHEQGS